jgi:hypothetical protein
MQFFPFLRERKQKCEAIRKVEKTPTKLNNKVLLMVEIAICAIVHYTSNSFYMIIKVLRMLSFCMPILHATRLAGAVQIL